MESYPKDLGYRQKNEEGGRLGNGGGTDNDSLEGGEGVREITIHTVRDGAPGARQGFAIEELKSQVRQGGAGSARRSGAGKE